MFTRVETLCVVVFIIDLEIDSQSKFPPANSPVSQTAFFENSKSFTLVLFKISATNTKSTLQLDKRQSSFPE